MKDKIVCKCNMVLGGDVQEFYENNPEMDLTEMKKELNIGTRCRCCLRDACPIVDVSFEEVIDSLKIK